MNVNSDINKKIRETDSQLRNSMDFTHSNFSKPRKTQISGNFRLNTVLIYNEKPEYNHSKFLVIS